jgi:hypothetical protein
MKLLTPMSRPILGRLASWRLLVSIAVLGCVAQLIAGCHDPAEHASAKPDPATSTIGPAPDPEPAGDQAARVQVRVKPHAQSLYRGERIWAAVSVQNNTDSPLRLPKRPRDLAVRGVIVLALAGEKPKGVVGPPHECFLTPLGPGDFVEVPAGDSWTFNMSVQDDACLLPIQADTYTLTAHLNHDGKWIGSPPVKVVLQELPNLDAFRKIEVKHQHPGGATVNQRAWVGIVPADESSGTLLAISPNQFGKTGAEPSMFFKTHRLGTVSLQANIQVEFMPSKPSGTEGDAHILVTQPDGAQHYHVMDLQFGNLTRSESFPERKVRFSKSETTGKAEIEIKQ